MSDETLPPLPAEAPAPESGPAPEEVFWNFTDVFVFAGMAIPAMLVGAALVRLLFWAAHLHPALDAERLLPEQFVGFTLLFAVLGLLFHLQYERPFWASLGWRRSHMHALWPVTAGLAAVVGVALLTQIVRLPGTSNRMLDMMNDPVSAALVSIYGITVGPLTEELAFRGFLQPLLVKRWGVVAGILGAAIPFGILHYWQYGNSWRHALLITFAGAAFGAMRQYSKSTRVAVIMHSAYNGVLFLAFYSQRSELILRW